jgi:CheY-like chemotaxis protein
MVLSQSGASRPPRILLVDDHAQNLELLEAYLEEVSAQITTAADGVEALASVTQSKPDLILLDVMMPRMSGFQLAAKLRASDATKAIPIIMVTALGEVSDVQRAADLGISDYLTKPVNKNELLTRVRSILSASTSA